MQQRDAGFGVPEFLHLRAETETYKSAARLRLQVLYHGLLARQDLVVGGFGFRRFGLDLQGLAHAAEVRHRDAALLDAALRGFELVLFELQGPD